MIVLYVYLLGVASGVIVFGMQMYNISDSFTPKLSGNESFCVFLALCIFWPLVVLYTIYYGIRAFCNGINQLYKRYKNEA